MFLTASSDGVGELEWQLATVEQTGRQLPEALFRSRTLPLYSTHTPSMFIGVATRTLSEAPSPITARASTWMLRPSVRILRFLLAASRSRTVQLSRTTDMESMVMLGLYPFRALPLRTTVAPALRHKIGLIS